MEVYAAQIDNLDQGVGRIIESLENNNIRNKKTSTNCRGFFK